MPRQNRIIDPEGGVYHITARGNNKMAIFPGRSSYLKFLAIIQETRLRFPFWMYHFTLMPNHTHFCLQPEKGPELPMIMKRINEQYSRYFRQKNNYVGHVWQGRYYSSLIKNDRYLWTSGVYIENNPVRAMLCEKAEDYEWSSARHYLLNQKHPIVTDNPQLADLGSDRNQQLAHYKNFFS